MKSYKLSVYYINNKAETKTLQYLWVFTRYMVYIHSEYTMKIVKTSLKA